MSQHPGTSPGLGWRVQWPAQKMDGRTLSVILASLWRQIKTDDLNRTGRLVVTDSEIRIEWEDQP